MLQIGGTKQRLERCWPVRDTLSRRGVELEDAKYLTSVVILDFQMREIQLRDAKATLSAALRGEEFAITRYGHPQAVVISWEAWKRLSNAPSFSRLLAASPLAAF
jgi:antitoxin Phd